MRPLPDEIRYALLGSPYEAPSVEPGDLLYCAYEGRRVVVAGWTRAVIPWPYHVKAGGYPAVIVSDELARAVKVEANMTVAHHWGVPGRQVTSWRKALGVGRTTRGTSKLLQLYGVRPPPGETVPGIVIWTGSPEVRQRAFSGRSVDPDVAGADVDRSRRDIRFIEDAADRMGRLLNELLELSRVGRVAGRPEEIPMTGLAREAVGLLDASIADRGVAVEVAPGIPIVVGDRLRLLARSCPEIGYLRAADYRLITMWL